MNFTSRINTFFQNAPPALLDQTVCTTVVDIVRVTARVIERAESVIKDVSLDILETYVTKV